MRVTTPPALVDAAEVPLDVEVELLLRDPPDEPPRPEEVGLGVGVALRVGVGVGLGVGVGVGVPVSLADGDGVGDPPALVVNAAKMTAAALFELVDVDVAAPEPVEELPVPELLGELPPRAIVVVPCAAASVKSASIVSEIVPLAAVAVR